jgi:hypothetical protein
MKCTLESTGLQVVRTRNSVQVVYGNTGIVVYKRIAGATIDRGALNDIADEYIPENGIEHAQDEFRPINSGCAYRMLYDTIERRLQEDGNDAKDDCPELVTPVHFDTRDEMDVLSVGGRFQITYAGLLMSAHVREDWNLVFPMDVIVPNDYEKAALYFPIQEGSVLFVGERAVGKVTWDEWRERYYLDRNQPKRSELNEWSNTRGIEINL